MLTRELEYWNRIYIRECQDYLSGETKPKSISSHNLIWENIAKEVKNLH